MAGNDPGQSSSIGQHGERSIRVFVSSTFKDMAAERDELMKQVFPELRRICEERGVSWSEVDLRWGITEEERAEGRVLPVCLAEIQECKPYFIGILGDRYGWVPDEIAPGLLEAEPWLSDARGRSVTELEILHGVLNDPGMADHAFFYFRDPNYLATLTPEQAANLSEQPRPEEIAVLGCGEAERRAADRREKLKSLKERIRAAYLAGELRHEPRENYRNPRDLGAMVRQDLSGLIDELFPAGSEPDPAVREDLAQAACARRHRRLYFAREAKLETLDRHAAGTAGPLAVTGEAGIGKSALLAFWADRYRAAHPSAFLVEHYADASPSSSDWRSLVRRLIAALQRGAGSETRRERSEGGRVAYARELGEEVLEVMVEGPSETEDLNAQFADVLRRTDEGSPVVLVIDGLSQLGGDGEQELELAWLPVALPQAVRLIASSRPGPALDEIRRRQWATMTVEPLTPDERRVLAVEHLRQYRKSLGTARMDRIVSAQQAGTPLYLLTLLDELRMWGEHTTLGSAIDRYLEAQNLQELFLAILKRWEQDYERDRPGLVRDSMTALWAARGGLSEREILQSLGSPEAPLPQAYWAPLHNAGGATLASRSGVLAFAHDDLRAAVEARYLQAETDRVAAHQRIAALFRTSPPGPRKLHELPWQLFRAGAWADLTELLCDAELTLALARFKSPDLRTYWHGIEAQSPFKSTEAYAGEYSRRGANPLFLSVLGQLFESLGHLDRAEEVFQRLARDLRERGDFWNLGKVAYARALIGRKRGDLNAAMAAMQEQEEACRRVGYFAGVVASIDGQAEIRRIRGDTDAATELYSKAEGIARRAGDLAAAGISLGNQARLLAAKGDFEAALARYAEEVAICRQLGDATGLSASLMNQGLIALARGDLDGAMANFRETESIARRLGDLDQLQITLGNEGCVLYDRGQLDEALELQKEKEQICRQLGRAESLYHALLNQAAILRVREQLDASLALVEEAESICKQMGHLHGLAECQSDCAAIFRLRGMFKEALAKFEEAEALYRRLGEVDGIAKSLEGQGQVLRDQKRLEVAMTRLRAEEEICRQHGFALQLASCLGNQATIWLSSGNLDEATALEKQAEAEYRKHGVLGGVVTSLGNQATILVKKGLFEEARPLVEEALGLAAELGLPARQRRLRHLLDEIRFVTGR